MQTVTDTSSTQTAPADAAPAGTAATDPTVIGSLSPSRAADFKTCPLLYRFRTVDRIPEQPTRAAVRGTVVHAALEALFDLPRDARTVDAARALIQPAWQQVLDGSPEVAELFAEDQDGSDLAGWLASAAELVSTYFAMEDPTHFDPAGREVLVETTLGSGLLLRGYVDRLDESASGLIRVVDYKTGAAPREMFEAKALFQMKFYALVVWRSTGSIPAQLKLMYLADRDQLTYSPDERELLSLERQLEALWAAIDRSLQSREFRPSRSRLCDWCDHKSRCPAWGGTPPPFPESGELTPVIDRRSEAAVAD